MKKKYWYLSVTEECPPCGKSSTYRERRYGPKPKAWAERYAIHQYLCYSCALS